MKTLSSKYIDHTDKNTCLRCGSKSDYILIGYTGDKVGLPLCNDCSEVLDDMGYYGKKWLYFFDTTEKYEQYISNNIKKLDEKGDRQYN